MSKSAAPNLYAKPSFAILLGTAALALVLSAPARAQVSVDYSQLDGVGAPTNNASAYENKHPVLSPFGAAQAKLNDDDGTPVVIGGKKTETLSTPAASAPVKMKSAIALKPLPAWHMPTPAQPISLGARAPLMLHPPGANGVITELAKQSPVSGTKTAILHLRPPAPKAPMPTYAQNITQGGLAPPLQTMVSPAVAQVANAAPMPMTQIGMAGGPVPMPQTQVVMAPSVAGAPPIPQGDLRAEDVVALDLGAPKHDDVPNSSAPGQDRAPDNKQSDAGPVAPPPASAGAGSAPVKTASSDKPQFMSSLSDDEDQKPSHNNPPEKDTHQDAMAPPPPVLREPKSEAPPQPDNSRNLAAVPTSSALMGGLNDNMSDSQSDNAPAKPAPASANNNAPSPAPRFTGSLSDETDRDVEPSHAAPPTVQKQNLAAKMQFTSPLGEDSAAPAPPTSIPAPEMKTGYLSEPAKKSAPAVTASSPDPSTPAEAQSLAEAKADTIKQKISGVKIETIKTAAKTAPTPAGHLQEPEVVGAAAAAAPDDIHWNNTPDASAPAVADVANSHASAQQAANAVADSLKPASTNTPTAKTAAAKPTVTAAAPPAPEVVATAPAGNADMDKVHAQIADANRRAEEVQKQLDAFTAQQKIAQAEADARAKAQTETIARAQADADIQAEIQADAIARAKTDELTKAQAEALAKAQADADARAKADQEIIKQQQVAMTKAQADAIAKAQADADAKAKVDAETLAQQRAQEIVKQQQAVMDKTQADAIAKAQADADAKAKADAEILAQQRAQDIIKQQQAVMAKAQADAIAKAQTDADARAKTQMDAMAVAQAAELAKVQVEADANKQRLAQLAQKQAEIEAQAKVQSATATANTDQIKTAAAVPVTPVSHTDIVELPKVVDNTPVRQAAISTGAMNDAAASPAASAAPMVQKTLLFQPGISALPSDAGGTVQQFAQDMKNNDSARIIISAYADASNAAGSAARRISLQRAVLVRDELNRMGVPINRMAVRAQTSDPGATNPDRVEINVQ